MEYLKEQNDQQENDNKNEQKNKNKEPEACVMFLLLYEFPFFQKCLRRDSVLQLKKKKFAVVCHVSCMRSF